MEIIQNTASDESLETVNLFLNLIREHLASTDDITDTELEYYLCGVLAKTLIQMRSNHEWLFEPCVAAVYASQLKKQPRCVFIQKIVEKMIRTA